jgi:LysR family transcriptional activator of nhaA
MIQLNYHHLYYFKVIATEGSISKAALKLNLGQPALSMQLKQFEESIGHALFERRNRSLVLTEVGKVTLTYANEIFRIGGEMLTAIEDRPAQKKTQLHIGVFDTVPKSLVRNLMLKAYQLGDCIITTIEGQGADLMRQLMDHHLDLVISDASASGFTQEVLSTRSLVKMPLIVAGPPKYKELQEHFPQSIADKPFVLPLPQSRVRHELEHFLADQVIRVNVVAEVQDSSLMKSLSVSGLAMMVVAEPAVQDLLEKGELIKIGNLDNYVEEIWLISAQRKLQNPIVSALMREF